MARPDARRAARNTLRRDSDSGAKDGTRRRRGRGIGALETRGSAGPMRETGGLPYETKQIASRHERADESSFRHEAAVTATGRRQGYVNHILHQRPSGCQQNASFHGVGPPWNSDCARRERGYTGGRVGSRTSRGSESLGSLRSISAGFNRA
jgi:hypothetical protein